MQRYYRVNGKEEAKQLLDKGLFKAALDIINQELEKDPANVYAQGLKGKILLDSKQYDLLYEFCDLVTEMMGKDSPAVRAITIPKIKALILEKKVDDAIKLCEELLKKDVNVLERAIITKDLVMARSIAFLTTYFSATKPLEVKEKPTSASMLGKGTSGILKELKIPTTSTLEEKPLSSYVTVDVPDDNSCLFWATFLSLMLPTLDNPTEFNQLYARLLGDQSIYTLKTGEDIRVHGFQMNDNFRKMLKAYDCEKESVSKFFLKEYKVMDNQIKTWGFDLYIRVFRERVVDMMDKMYSSEEKGVIAAAFFAQNWNAYAENMSNSVTWAGQPEIKAIAELAQTNIHLHIEGSTPTIYTPRSATVAKTIHLVNTHSGDVTVNNHYHYQLHPDLHKKQVLQAAALKINPKTEGTLQQSTSKIEDLGSRSLFNPMP